MPTTTLITNVNVFDGKHDHLIEKANVLVEGNKIKTISIKQIAANFAIVIDGGGCTLTPGLIDCHVHLQWNMGSEEMFYAPPDYLSVRALAEAKDTLMHGYTSVRNISGQVLRAKKAIDEGRFVGPRIWSNGAGLSMTVGHGDMRTNYTLPRQLGGPAWTDVEYMGMSIFADGVSEVLNTARLQLRKGAHFLKMYTSGAVSGPYDPLDIAEYSFEEIKAAADEAKRWNTYLAVHTYNDSGTSQALEAGAMSIEHATIITEETMKLLVEKGAFLSTQTGVNLADPPPNWSEDMQAKQRVAKAGLDQLFKLAKKHNAKIATGTDLVGSLDLKSQQAYELTNRLTWFTPAEILKQATANNAELLSWSGPRNPYPGKLGMIEEGAYADLLLITGNPLEDLTLSNKPEENLALIMKNGKVYKNNC